MSSTATSRTRWAAIGAAFAVALGGGTFAFVTADGAASSFVPITPCRLLDTRASSPVGPRSTPITAGESLTVQVTGSNGQCVIPASATAIVINVTAVQPSASGFMTIYPADVALPNASNLNFTAGQSPAPNLVTVSLSAGGAIKIFNETGHVNVLGDIAGYYQADTGTGNEGAACTADGLAGVTVNGFDHEHNVSSHCFTALVSTLAGTGASGTTNGTGFEARFSLPWGVAVDTVGNIYVADESNNLIRKITVDGVVTTLAGSGATGSGNGTGTDAEFDSPFGVAVDLVGNVYVADAGNGLIRKITPAGEVSNFAGSTPGYFDAAVGIAQFDHPVGVAVDSAGVVYVADSNNHVIRKITAGEVTTLAGDGSFGTDDGTGGDARFNTPQGLVADAAGNVYVADTVNCRIRKVTAVGAVTTIAGSSCGFADGTETGAQFDGPVGIVLDSLGDLYVADSSNHRIRKVTLAGVVTTVAGAIQAYEDGPGLTARFESPVGLTIDGAGTMYVVEWTNRVRRIK